MFQQMLLAAGPHPELPKSELIFAPFIGSWDLDVTWYVDASPVRRARGEWHFTWVLEGRAVQDVWLVPPKQQREVQGAELYEYGTSIRYYDRKLDAWRSIWIGPMQGVVRSFVARANAETVTLESDGREPRQRWVFSRVESNSFKWQNLEQTLQGDWTLVQEFNATRVRNIVGISR